MRALLLSLSLLLAALPALAQDRAELWRRCEGSGANRDEKLASCTKLIESLRESEQDLAVAYYYRGLLYHWDERQKAIADQSEAIRLNPWFVDAFIERGRAHAGERDYDRAIRDFGEALRLEPGNALALAYRGEANRGKGLYQDAIRDLDESIRLNPDLSLAYDKRRKTYEDMGEHDRARRTDPNALAYGCGLFARSEKYDRAMEFCNRALAIWPNQPLALVMRGMMLLKGGRRDAAIADLDRALRRDRWSRSASFAFALRGAAYFGNGRLDEAIADFDAAIRLDKHYAMSRYGRGLARLRKGDAAGAAADIAAAKAQRDDIEGDAAEYGLK